MHSLVSYGCATAAGDGAEALWQVVKSGRDCAGPDGFLFHGRSGTDLDLLTRKLALSFRSMRERAPAAAANRLLHDNFGVILASTKGCANDFIFAPTAEQMAVDPLTPLLESALKTLELRPWRSCVVSNACSSSLAAVKLAQLWLNQGMTDVIVLAADVNSRFVRKGFESLKLLSQARPRPFSATRDGFLLGDAAACLWLSNHPAEGMVIHPVGLDSEGSTVTRPEPSSESLLRAALKIPLLQQRAPDVILAHGTATPINDQTEDLALSRLLPAPVTASKWATGHTLAASGALDLILACEMLKHGQTFDIFTTAEQDPALKMNYLVRGQSAHVAARVLVSSLGFGGMHAAALVEKP